jgi:Na+-transporting methylmalonyl-CoA/oxaloacetate decarboxylase gamma subunit
MNDAISFSFVTMVITVIISFFIAFVVKIMTVILHKFTKESDTTITSDVVESSDESEIAAVIAIAKSKQ